MAAAMPTRPFIPSLEQTILQTLQGSVVECPSEDQVVVWSFHRRLVFLLQPKPESWFDHRGLRPNDLAEAILSATFDGYNEAYTDIPDSPEFPPLN